MVAAACTSVVLAAACSTGDGTDIDARGGSNTSADTVATSEQPPEPTPVGTERAPSSAPTLPREPIVTAAPPPTAPPGPTVTAPPVSDVPETGVPGLDSTDAFCAAWSRFGGSFQVVAVNAAFGAGSVEERAFVEVVAAPTVVAAHADMAALWPEAIDAEAGVALDEVFGPFARRLAAATDALDAAGLSADQRAALDAAWLRFLADRDPTDAEVDVDVGDEIAAVVATAVPAYLDEVGPWADDESLVTAASTPLTDAYLATECPDQGTLAGGEVEG